MPIRTEPSRPRAPVSGSATSSVARALNAVRRDPLKALVGCLALASVADARPVSAFSGTRAAPRVGARTDARTDSGGSTASLALAVPVTTSLAQPGASGAALLQGNHTLDARAQQLVISMRPARPASAIVHTHHHGDVEIFARPGQSIEDRIAEVASNDAGDASAVLRAGEANRAANELEFSKAVEVLQKLGTVAQLKDMPPEGLKALSSVLSEMGRRHLKMHVAWHSWNGKERSGGEEGWGSGEVFLGFHRQLVVDVENQIGPNYRLPAWEPTDPLPPELIAQTGTPHTRDPKIPERTFLAVDGGGGWDAWYGSEDLEDRVFEKLTDFKTLDELGRGIAGSGYHASVHLAIGGAMATFESPTDNAFYEWHGKIDRIVQRWLECESGRAWLNASANDPITDRTTPFGIYESVHSLSTERRRRNDVGTEISDNMPGSKNPTV